MFPVGYVMILATNINPNRTIGGTWQKIKSGKFLEATENDGELKNEVQPGLPNITGHGAWGDNVKYFHLDGCFYYYVESSRAIARIAIEGKCRYYIRMDASRSSAIYGRSSTVQPSSIKVVMWIRVA